MNKGYLFKTVISFLLDIYPEVRWLNHILNFLVKMHFLIFLLKNLKIVLFLTFWGTTILFSIVVIFPPTVYKSSLFSISLLTLVTSYLLDDGHSHRSEAFIVVWLSISLMISDTEHLFMYLLAKWRSSLEKCLFSFSAHFLNQNQY